MVQPMLVIDTGVLMRLVVWDAITSAFDFRSILKRGGARLWVAPSQEDELFRNLRNVYDEVTASLEKDAKDSRTALDTVVVYAKKLEGLGLVGSDFVATQQASRAALDRVEKITSTYQDAEVLAEDLLSDACRVDESEPLVRAAEARVRAHNPPCSDSKPRARGDCEVWELVLTLLAKDRHVWFVTADADFCYRKTRELHPFLVREVRSWGDAFRFIYDSPRSSRLYDFVEELATIAKASEEERARLRKAKSLQPYATDAASVDEVSLVRHAILRNAMGSLSPIGEMANIRAAMEAAMGSLNPVGEMVNTRAALEAAMGSLNPVGEMVNTRAAMEAAMGSLNPIGEMVNTRAAMEAAMGSLNPIGEMANTRAAIEAAIGGPHLLGATAAAAQEAMRDANPLKGVTAVRDTVRAASQETMREVLAVRDATTGQTIQTTVAPTVKNSEGALQSGATENIEDGPVEQEDVATDAEAVSDGDGQQSYE
ncbi:MAG: hypothetical protein RIT81_09265 [Deltaproteobacteria bacterium]